MTCSFDKTLLAFALIHFVLQDQTCLLFRVTLDFLLHSSPLWWKWHLLGVSVLEGVGGLYQFCSSVMSDSLRPHGLQLARLPHPSLSPWVCSKSCPLSQWWHLILCHPLLLLPSIFPSIRVSSNELAPRSRGPELWSFGFSISLSSESSGLTSFRMDKLGLLSVQGVLESKSAAMYLCLAALIDTCRPAEG